MSCKSFQRGQAILYAALIYVILVFAILGCSTIAHAQASDRISSLDLKIRLSKDRTLHVDERFEITNDNGFFDAGFHRRLQLKARRATEDKGGLVSEYSGKG
jgi:hypothetical protein